MLHLVVLHPSCSLKWTPQGVSVQVPWLLPLQLSVAQLPEKLSNRAVRKCFTGILVLSMWKLCSVTERLRAVSDDRVAVAVPLRELIRSPN